MPVRPLSVVVSLSPGPVRNGFLSALKAVAPNAGARILTEEEAIRALASSDVDLVVAEAKPGARSSDVLVIASRNSPRTARILVAFRNPGTLAAAHAHAVVTPPFNVITERSLAGILGLVAYYRSLPDGRRSVPLIE